ncbi:homogentisate geranylgeranyltransferase-like [Telopea speciosissima]|uniref:homogentisate geranylgeranyltransferase-like n=1 Tax=Telopea speciosissima TaxID=54955 RepID=UPI001CC49364|nr:homogentisate geranylgeranyltransferase-like [Telopea speciosissima]
MEALLTPAFSTFSLPMCPPLERVPESNLHGIHRKWNVKQSHQLSALSNEKLPNDNFILENELSPKHEDHYVRLLQKLKAFYQFCRPYTIIANIVGISSVSLLPIESIADLTPTFFMGYLKVLVVSTLNLIYINGVNQLFDIEIDKVNKPYLPLASEEFSTRDAVAISLLATTLSIGLGLLFKSPPLLWSAVISCLGGFSAGNKVNDVDKDKIMSYLNLACY